MAVIEILYQDLQAVAAWTEPWIDEKYLGETRRRRIYAHIMHKAGETLTFLLSDLVCFLNFIHKWVR